MEVAHIAKTLRSHKLLLGIVVFLSLAAAVGLALRKPAAATGAATAQILVDSPQSVLGDLQQDPGALNARASVLAQVMASDAVLPDIARAAGVPVDQIAAQGPFAVAGSSPSSSGPSTPAITKPYSLMFVAQDTIPIISIAAKAPTPALAARLANGAYEGLSVYLRDLQGPATAQTDAPSSDSSGTSSGSTTASATRVRVRFRVIVRALGRAQATTAAPASSKMIAIAGATLVLVVGLVMIAGVDAFQRRRRSPPQEEVVPAGRSGDFRYLYPDPRPVRDAEAQSNLAVPGLDENAEQADDLAPYRPRVKL